MSSHGNERRHGGHCTHEIVFSRHALARFAERYAKTNDVDAEALEAARAATWAGKTSTGALILRRGVIDFIVQRWDYKYRVITVRDALPGGRVLDLHADVRPKNPPRLARRST